MGEVTLNGQPFTEAMYSQHSAYVQQEVHPTRHRHYHRQGGLEIKTTSRSHCLVHQHRPDRTLCGRR